MADVARKMLAEQHYTHVIFDMDGLLLGKKYVLFSAVLYYHNNYGGWLHRKSISLRPLFYWPRVATLQLGILPSARISTPAHLTCQAQLQPRNSYKMSIPAMQNS